MRKQITTTLFLVFTVFLLSAQEYTGPAASRHFKGTDRLRMVPGRDLPEYMNFIPEARFLYEDIDGWMKTNMGMDQQMGFRNIRVQDDKAMGMVHYRNQQTLQGVPVWDANFIAHTKDGKVFSMNGVIYRDLQVSNQVLLTNLEALGFALDYIGGTKYMWEDPAEEANLKQMTGNSSASYFPSGELMLFPAGQGGEQFHEYVWMFNIYAKEPLQRAEVFVNAADGSIMFRNERLYNSDTLGTAVTKYSGIREITADYFEGMFRLREAGRGNGVETYDLNNSNNYGNALDFTDTDNYWNNVNTQEDEVATDAHWGAEMTYDYYWLKHNRNSIDDQGFKLLSYVHYNTNYANAFWDGQRMTYGDGGANYSPFTALDICGHEVTHGLTEFTANLVYSYESGAMNEGFSDIFGVLIEWFGKPTLANWTMGEDIGEAFRSMANPNLYEDPDTYLGDYWYIGSGDNGGVHTNSGVLNFWFYLLCQGGSGTNDNGDVYTVNGLGFDTAGAIAYRTLTYYLIPTHQYYDARFYAVLASADLYGGCSPAMIATTNAMYAVGIGPEFTSGVSCAFTAGTTEFCKLPAVVFFTNSSTNAFSFIWDFGDGTTSTDVNPVHTYYTEGTYTVKLVADGDMCGIDSLTKVDYVILDLPEAPVVTNASYCGGASSLTLSASAPDTVNWFDIPQGGVPIYTGYSFTTPVLSQTTSYYVENWQIDSAIHGGKLNNTGGGNNYTQNIKRGEIFTTNSPIRIVSVKVYAQGAGVRNIELQDNQGTVLQNANINIPTGESRITLNFDVPTGTDFGLYGPANPNLYRNNAGCAYPYAIGSLATITKSSAAQSPTGVYYYFYDWEVIEQPCISERVKVTAFINFGLPQASFTVAYSGGGLIANFTNTTIDGNDYLWDFGDGVTSTQLNPAHVYAAPGTYTVSLTANNSCGTNTTQQTLTLIITGIGGQGSAEALTVSPNPASDMLRIQWNMGTQQNAVIMIFDMMGKEVWSESLQALSGNFSRTIDVSGFAPGLYSLKAVAGNLQATRRIIIE